MFQWSNAKCKEIWTKIPLLFGDNWGNSYDKCFHVLSFMHQSLAFFMKVNTYQMSSSNYRSSKYVLFLLHINYLLYLGHCLNVWREDRNFHYLSNIPINSSTQVIKSVWCSKHTESMSQTTSFDLISSDGRFLLLLPKTYWTKTV